ncbi:MAG TPA: carboxylating nicotinate-nucleotide diphosphorylase [Chloroflexota bacterium]|nr:carboxylating nicotinate-nucleotide diphosphorylase [Chloroflexota bacterium]
MRRELARVVRNALDEDLGWGDVTTDALVPPDQPGRGVVLIKAEGVLAGLDAVVEVFHQLDPAVSVELRAADGEPVRPGQEVAVVAGPAGSILTGERVALNLLQRLSGIATATRRYVDAVAGTSARIIDTRKTTPGLRALEKYAVRVGGGTNHRMSLSDGVLIKDNHLAALRSQGHGIPEAIRRARARAPHTIRVEVEVTTVEQADQAAGAGADIVLLDNMPPERMAEAVRRVNGRSLTEASGGVRLETVRAVAESGVDLISVGALTHSTPALDISLELTLA